MPTMHAVTHRGWMIFVVAWLLLLAGAFAIDGPAKQWLFERQFHDDSAGVFKGTWWADAAKLFGTFYIIAPLTVGLVLCARLSWVHDTLGDIPNMRNASLNPGRSLNPTAPSRRSRPWIRIHGRVAQCLLPPIVSCTRLPWRKGVVIMACAATGGIADILKPAFGRPRPVLHGQLTGWIEFHPFHADVAKAFPSSHTMVAFATATVIARYYPRWAVLAFALAAMVGAQRVLEVAHHVSDVVAAAGLGILTSCLCMNLLRTWAASPADTTPENESEKETA